MPRVRVNLLGEGSLRIDGVEIAVPRVMTGIVGYLLLQPKYTASRDRLASALWPASTDAAARHALANAIYRVRAALPAPCAIVAMSGDRCVLNRSFTGGIDLAFLERRLDRLFARQAATPRAWRRRLGRMLGDAGGTLFAEIDEEWAAFARERWRCRRLDALVLLADLAAREGDWGQAVALGRDVCAAEPLREDAQRLLIDALARSGNRALALCQYRLCAQVLRDELDVAPMAETRALAARLRDDDVAPTGTPLRLREALIATRVQLRTALDHVESALATH